MRKIYLLICLFPAFWQTASAQMPTDALMMPKGQLCTLVGYTHSSWDEYWQGETKRSNSNIGTFTSQNVMLMPNYGITDNLNVMLAVPYVWTGSDSYLQGEKGVQDISLWLKYQPFTTAFAGGEFKVQVAGGASIPSHDYPADFLPFSIGFHSKTASLRGVLNYTHNLGFYLTAQAGHTWRGKVKIDRDSYLYDNVLYYTNEVPVPNMLDATGRLGFINKRLQAEVTLDYFTGLSGDDIRYNEAPFLTNKMQATTAGIFAKVFIGHFAVQASAGQVLSGRNVGQSAMFSGGFTYQFGLGGGAQEDSK